MKPGRALNARPGFVIPSIYGHKRMQNRFRQNMENSPQSTRGYADICLQRSAKGRAGERRAHKDKWMSDGFSLMRARIH